MSACGDADDCISTPEASELAAKLDEKEINNLPRPGQVEFINGGPSLSGLIKALGVNFNVRFGILEAGAYGVCQSRKRALIWAASPEETLPEWPEPMHVFAGPELKVKLSGNSQYAAVRSTATGAPFRSITYTDEPVSWFQKKIRGDMLLLSDQISKEMNELNFIRCQRIPKRPGSDWRDLPDEKLLKFSFFVELFNTAKRHNQWKGLFGRLDWEGNFPTSITDPQPMGKVGMCFQPDQDRILTVRECACSHCQLVSEVIGMAIIECFLIFLFMQGFSDCYKFAGNIQHEHRQIGNAVPPPLSFALGRKLKEAVEKKHSTL
ncbi:hypothetical protein Pint_13856 [Pistacia integerrima]|uniref:Uncharacterized protein n=1 Tax=Pistacia integerrima TaxID=434235 RepID=A0ACC0Y7N2_9ROSI|nr:hypothetical protein Pint_13856 [Pistacia integerrima]